MVEKRLYQVWPGKNRFLFSGLLIFGPDVKSLLLTVFLIVAPAIVFCVFVARHLLHKFSNYNSGIAIIVVAGFLTLYVLIILLCTSGRDPGIIPRNPHPPEPEEYDSSASPADWAGGQTPRWRLPRTKDVVVNNVTVKVKYCDTCMLYRPPRCSHCSICNNCVERFDHHCPWVGQCIGKRNYRFFFMFVSSATLLCIYVFAMSALYIKFLMQGDPQTGDTQNVWQAVAKSPASIVLMVYTFIAVWFVGGLSLFHLYLISTNQTTYENFRYRYDSRENPYSLGVIRNFLEVFCSRVEPSKVNFCAKVQVDSSGQRVLNPPPTASISGNPHIEAKPSWEAGDNEGGHARISGFSDLGLDAKDNFDDNVPHGASWPLSSEVSEHRTGAHPRRSSWGRKSGSWEITPEILALAVGNTEAGKLDVSHAEKEERLDEQQKADIDKE